MKKILFGVIVVIVALSSCFSHEQKKQSNRWWVPEKKDVISWEKLDTIVVGEGGLFKLEYPDCFELSEESDDSSVLVTYKEISGLFLTANAEKNPYHWNVDTLADLIVKGRKAEDRDSIIMQDMHDGYFYLKGIMGANGYCFYEQYVVFHDYIFTLTLVYPLNIETKMENLFRLVHDWHPETNMVLATMKSDDMKERMSVLKKRGGMHNYREFYIEESDNGYHFMVYDSCHHNRQEIVFDADDYLNGGVPGMYAFVSPDKKYVYVVGDILANSTGWVSTFIIYQVNTETLKAKLVNAVAAIKLEKTGFTVASMTRCVTPDTYISSAMDFAFEDITYGFNGKIKRKSKEYASKEIKERYGKLCNLNGLGLKREDI